MAVTLSEERAQLVRQRILGGTMATLRAGRGWTFATVAAAAGVPERTVYRYFPSREDLLHALFEQVNERIGLAATLPSDAAELAGLVRRAFVTFDEMAPVVDELLAAPEGRQARLRNKQQRQRAALALARRAAPGLRGDAARRLAAVYQLLGSAAAWQSLRDFWGMSGEEAAATVELAIGLLAAGAKAKRRRPARPSRKEAT